jgi:hypothetical protein
MPSKGDTGSIAAAWISWEKEKAGLGRPAFERREDLQIAYVVHFGVSRSGRLGTGENGSELKFGDLLAKLFDQLLAVLELLGGFHDLFEQLRILAEPALGRDNRVVESDTGVLMAGGTYSYSWSGVMVGVT